VSRRVSPDSNLYEKQLTARARLEARNRAPTRQFCTPRLSGCNRVNRVMAPNPLDGTPLDTELGLRELTALTT